ncbi:hypothetical protein TrLO_g362 [Triparma laevis f. longispina]|uniref:Uncharacterized protein n=1 Tax=Triparma laevis f. longispina TaxID=1714387 RepID=A0A9W7F7V0_9STRA|nr:hypothetical protein TrLO_g362 [Triparma laevis f. longispina]
MQAFLNCSELKSMTIPDSLQTLGIQVFYACSKLVPSNSNWNAYDNDAVVPHLHSQQKDKKKKRKRKLNGESRLQEL